MITSKSTMVEKYSEYVNLYNKNKSTYGHMENPMQDFNSFQKNYNKLWRVSRSSKWSAEAVVKRIVMRDTTSVTHAQALAASRGGTTTYKEARFGTTFWDSVSATYKAESITRGSAGAKAYIAHTFFGSP